MPGRAEKSPPSGHVDALPRKPIVLAPVLGGVHVAFCLDDPDLPKLKRQGEGSNLLRSLAEGGVPAWLEPLETDGPIRVWRIR
jgi:hypothetical protein